MIGMRHSWVNRLISKWGGTGRRLLALPTESCVYCGKEANSNRSPLGLCSNCHGRIPWITEVLCGVCGRYENCNDCVRRTETFFRMNRSAVRYDAAMKEWLARWKYRGDERLQKLFADMSYHGYRKLLEDAGLRQDDIDGITYVPVNKERFAERGFNQSEQLARGLAAMTGTPVYRLLKRDRNTPKQSFKSRSQRLLDLQGVFVADEAEMARLVSASPHRQTRIILLDDVYTTGSTIQECSAVIRKQTDAAVYSLTWAR